MSGTRRGGRPKSPAGRLHPCEISGLVPGSVSAADTQAAQIFDEGPRGAIYIEKRSSSGDAGPEGVDVLLDEVAHGTGQRGGVPRGTREPTAMLLDDVAHVAHGRGDDGFAESKSVAQDDGNAVDPRRLHVQL